MQKEKQLGSIESSRNVPKLRFPEFEGKWETKEFGKIAKRRKERFNPKESNDSFPCIELECLSQETGILLNTFNSNEQKSIKNVFSENDILFGKLRPYLKKFYKAEFKGVCSSEIWVLTGLKVGNDYLFYLIQTDKFNYEVNQTSGSKMPRAEWAYISDIIFHFPSQVEQQKIAQFLTALDTRIQSLEKKKSLLEQYKKGVMQKIFKQELRLKGDDGNAFPAWEKKKLKDIFTRKTLKNKGSELKYVLTNSATKGIVSQNDYFDKEIANQNNLEGYYVVDVNDFVYNPRISQSAPVGPLKRNKLSKGVMSPLYTILEPKSGNLDYFEFYFETTYWYKYMKSIANFGVRHDRMNITISDFENLPIPFPTAKEQTKIANFLSAIDKKIELTNQQIVHTKTYKKGLLQQMFV